VVRGSAKAYFDATGSLLPLSPADKLLFLRSLVSGSMPPQVGLSGEPLAPLTAADRQAIMLAVP
jgi:hypothetical protein